MKLNNLDYKKEICLVNRTSVKREGIGKCSIVGKNPEPVLFDCSIIRLRLNKQVALPKYVMYFLNSPWGKSQILALSETADYNDNCSTTTKRSRNSNS